MSSYQKRGNSHAAHGARHLNKARVASIHSEGGYIGATPYRTAQRFPTFPPWRASLDLEHQTDFPIDWPTLTFSIDKETSDLLFARIPGTDCVKTL